MSKPTFESIMPLPTFESVMPLVWDYYDGHPGGGSLHIVLDDGNLETHWVQSCRDEAKKEGDEDAVVLADLLLQMTVTQRDKVCRHACDRDRAELVRRNNVGWLSRIADATKEDRNVREWKSGD